MEELRIGVVGTGFIGNRHLDALSRLPFTRVVAVVDAAPGRAEQVAKRYGATAYSSVEAMLEGAQVDAVHNCTPTNMHYAINRQVIEAGKHLYCEKPLGLTAREGDELVQMLRDRPVATGVNLNYRMNALVQDMHYRIASGESGRPFMVTGSYMQDWMLLQDDYDWRLDPAVGGPSRAIADIGSHLFDTSQFVIGKRITAVNASMVKAYATRLRYEKQAGTFSDARGALLGEVQVCNEDGASIMLRFSDGTQGLFQVSQISAGHKNDMRLRFDLSECSYEWHQESSDQLLIGRRGAPNQVMFREARALHPKTRPYAMLPAGHPEGWNDAMYNAIGAFYASILDGSYQQENVPYARIEDGAWIMKIIEACLKSDKTGRWTEVETGESA